MKPGYSGYRPPQPKVPDAWNKDKESRRLWRATQKAVNSCMTRHVTEASRKNRGLPPRHSETKGARHV